MKILIFVENDFRHPIGFALKLRKSSFIRQTTPSRKTASSLQKNILILRTLVDESAHLRIILLLLLFTRLAAHQGLLELVINLIMNVCCEES